MLFNREGAVNEGEDLDARSEALILEAALLDIGDDELEEMLENTQDLDIAISENIALERTIVRLDKKARLNKARKMSIFEVAKEKNDPKFKKLMTVWRWERFLENYLEKRYGAEATRRAKKSLRKNANTSSKMVSKAVKKAQKSFSDLNSHGKYSHHNNSTPKTKLNGAIPSR